MFNQETVHFLSDLKENNTKDWFAANKQRYETHVKKAAGQFCDDLATRLGARYDTDITCKVFRIHRDLRFSKDKTPYNTHLHISFSDAATGAAWMFGLQTDSLVLGYGLFEIPKEKLTLWREVVAGPQGTRLAKVLSNATSSGLRLSEPTLKRVPPPYPADHANKNLLRRKSLAIWHDMKSQDQAFGPDAAAKIADAMVVFEPIRNWITDAVHF